MAMEFKFDPNFVVPSEETYDYPIFKGNNRYPFMSFKSLIPDCCGFLSNAMVNRDKYTPKRIIFNGPATIVFWKDGSKTIVKRAKKDKDNKYNAFCAALAKKIFVSNSYVNSIVESGVVEK